MLNDFMIGRNSLVSGVSIKIDMETGEIDDDNRHKHGMINVYNPNKKSLAEKEEDDDLNRAKDGRSRTHTASSDNSEIDQDSIMGKRISLRPALELPKRSSGQAT